MPRSAADKARGSAGSRRGGGPGRGRESDNSPDSVLPRRALLFLPCAPSKLLCFCHGKRLRWLGLRLWSEEPRTPERSPRRERDAAVACGRACACRASLSSWLHPRRLEPQREDCLLPSSSRLCFRLPRSLAVCLSSRPSLPRWLRRGDNSRLRARRSSFQPALLLRGRSFCELRCALVPLLRSFRGLRSSARAALAVGPSFRALRPPALLTLLRGRPLGDLWR